ncbi:MAG: glycosyl hydrolase 115 family protein [Verrucomicrobiota bacterium JB022]|nr:glycosyl hydrolase 115 family protein [Verrucomicrobiota bacterium JB022]
MRLRARPAFLFLLLGFTAAAFARPSLGLPVDLVADGPTDGAFPLVAGEQAATLYVDANDHAGVIRAAGDLQADIERVTDRRPELRTQETPRGQPAVLIGTLGHSTLIDSLARAGKIDTQPIAGQWESFLIATVDDPMPGVEQALVIAGSDKRGTIYGIYEVSEQIGVSPWYWWADVPPARQPELFIAAGAHVQGPPVVKYRGIFINDEEPAFGPWAREQFGGINSKMYVHMYELLLRLRANYLWPAMWGKSLYEADPESARLADEYGIVIGTSHHEPMMRAHHDWTMHRQKMGNGEWNYATNEEGLQRFFRAGIERNRDYETLITVGMRGDGDEPMAGDDDMAANIALLEKVVDDQRAIIADVLGKKPEEVPQIWALYKEVADYYAEGMRVPDDITLLWCDDNWGNNRRLPTAEERKRSGGAGIYYHFDYVGSPRSYKWMNVSPQPKIWEQMTMAADYGADRVWIVNVGDLKPMELPIEFFLRLAWDPEALPKERIDAWTRRWAEREFGPEHEAAIADLVAKYAKYNAWRKPELLEPDTFSFVNYREAQRVDAAWQDLVAEAERVGAQIPAEQRDAYFQLVQYPVVASATVARLYLAAGRNQLYAKQGRASTLAEAKLARELFAQDAELTEAYHAVADGKWNHMMAQTRIGYTTWSDPKTNIMPEVVEPKLSGKALLGVAIEGSEAAWPQEAKALTLPGFDSIGQQRRWIDVFRQGEKTLSFQATASEPWVRLSTTSGDLAQDQRVWVDIDWTKAPVGEAQAYVTVQSGQQRVRVQVDTLRSKENHLAARPFFGSLTGPVAIHAEQAMANVPAPSARWERIPDYGRGPSGLSIFPTTAQSILPPHDAPRLEYRVLFPQAGEVPLDLITGVALGVLPGRGVRLAVSLNDQPAQIVDLFEGTRYEDPTTRPDKSAPAIRGWHDWVRNNAVTTSTMLNVPAAGVHTLKVWMVDPGIVLQKLVVHTGEVRPSYFGPVPEPVHAAPHVAYEPWNENGRIAHQQLLEKAQQGQIDLYFLGDSITRRWGATDYPEFLTHWREQFHGWNAANFGWGGDSTHHMLWRIQNGELDGLRPKVVVLLAGTNNIGNGEKPERAADVAEGVAALIETIQAKVPDATIILTAIFPRNDSPHSNAVIAEANRQLALLADGERVRFLNINDQLADADGQLYEGVTVDRLHLSLQGYEIWARNLVPLLAELLGPRAAEDHAPAPTGDPSAIQR